MRAELHLGDAESVVAGLAANSVGAVITDPPYAIRRLPATICDECGNEEAVEGWASCIGCLAADSLPRPRFEMLGTVSANWHEKATHSRGFADHDSDAYREMMGGVAAACARASKPGAYLVSFGHGRTLHEQAAAWATAGFAIRDVVTWVHRSGFAKAPTSLAPHSELALIGRLGGPDPLPLRPVGDMSTVIEVPKERHGLSHPSVKPLSLMRRLVSTFAAPGLPVLDPFAGSGTTLRAALDLGLPAIGVEQDPNHHTLALRRLGQGVLALEVPS